jgi:hypothetical protein
MPLLRPRVTTAEDVSRAMAEPTLSRGGVAVAPPAAEDPYFSKIISYIPAEVVAAYQVMAGAIAASSSPSGWWLNLVWIGFLAAITPLWIKYATSDPVRGIEAHRFQMYSAAVAFLVWVFALGGAWEQVLPEGLSGPTRQLVGSMLLFATTLVIPLLEKLRERGA